MLKNYFKVAIRSLLRDKLFSVIKILGLAIALSASLIIVLFVVEDLSYDTHHENYDRIVRVLTIDNAQGVSSKLVGVSQPALGPAAEAEIPEVVKSARVAGSGRIPLQYEDNLLKADQAFMTESSFFEIFSHEILEGPATGLLDEPNSIVITEKLSKRLFGDESPVGKSVKHNNIDLHVTALIKNPPATSHLQFDMLRSLVAPPDQPQWQSWLTNWSGISMFTYFLLDRPRAPEEINPKLKEIAQKNEANEFFTPTIQPLADVHTQSKSILFESNANKTDSTNIYVLCTIALLIIILATVNFTNLVTAKSTNRAKEVGIRKIVGALRHQLIVQYLLESFIITVVAALLAILFTTLAMPYFNNLYQRFADANLLQQNNFLLFYLGLVAVVAFLAGLYPAFFLSAFRPMLVLKGAFKNQIGGVTLRKSLVVLQFTISIALMIGMGIVFQQVEFINAKDLGYSREQIISLPLNNREQVADYQTLRNELSQHTGILSVASSSARMGQQLGRIGVFPEGAPEDENYITTVMSIDEAFIPTMEMTVLDGRNFSPDFPADSASNMLINEAFAEMMQWEAPVGKTVRLSNGPDDYTEYTVVGLVKDFHFATIRHKVEPLFMLYSKNNSSIAIKVNTDRMKETLAFIESTWQQMYPASPFEYAFLDEQFASLYSNEKAFSRMITHFTILALLIAMMGLFALSAYSAEQRQKEVGIRKVLGAEVSGIVMLLSKDFIRLVLIAFVLAAPIAYYVMQQWLSDFSYHVAIGWEVFVLTGAAATIIAWLTVSYQSVKAALMNPVKSLRAE